MNTQKLWRNRRYPAIASAASLLVVAGCHEVKYNYKIPESDADCPQGYEHRSSGAGIVDRSSGAGIVDRNGDPVIAFCYKTDCPGDNWDDSVAPTMEWHQMDDEVVIARRRCEAP